ncbi:hypothetical protein [Paenibacillus sp. sgz500958]|uniref:hypothetical protein n=1 Tax=Paenibacillus sp. sgz500958 TaxID=3242475 RepID=UPI0036D21966
MDNQRHKYKAFGLHIASDFVLEGLLPSDGLTEIEIKNESLPVSFSGSPNTDTYVMVGTDGFAFRVRDIGAFLITGGNSIIADKHEDCELDAFVLYLLGTCMGALLMQRGLLPVHGSALAVNGRHIIISGQSGAGKSTLAASLGRQGAAFLADDIAALQEDEQGAAWIIPAFPRQKLWRDTAERIWGNVDVAGRIPGYRDKYRVVMDDQFIAEPRKLDALVELSTYSGHEVRIREVRGTDKLMLLMRNVFRHELVELMGRQSQHFTKCTRIASSLPVFHIERPMEGFTTNEQIENLLLKLEKL